VTTIGFEQTSPTAVGVNTVVPTNCMSAPYTAGPGEMAIINMGLQAFSNGANHLLLAPLYSLNGGAATFAVSQFAIQYIAPGTSATSTSFVSMPLTSGTSYRFMTGARLGADTGVTATNVVCRAVVVIVKRQ
jgi:hypothetical protein